MRDRLAGAAALAALLLGAGASLAQQPVVIGGSGQPSVYVNTQVLNSLTPGFAPGSPYAPYNHGAYGYQQPGAFGQAAYGQPAYGQQPATIGGYYITRPSTLLFPPQQFPRSQVTVSPQQLAALRTAPATPSGAVELTPPSAAPAPGAVPSSMPSLPAPTASSTASAPGQEPTDARAQHPRARRAGSPGRGCGRQRRSGAGDSAAEPAGPRTPGPRTPGARIPSLQIPGAHPPGAQPLGSGAAGPGRRGGRRADPRHRARCSPAAERR